MENEKEVDLNKDNKHLDEIKNNLEKEKADEENSESGISI